MHAYFVERSLIEDVKQVRQSDDMIEVGVRQKDIQLVRFDVLRKSKERRSSIEDNAGRGNHHASRLPMFVRMVSGGAKKDDLHEVGLAWSLV